MKTPSSRRSASAAVGWLLGCVFGMLLVAGCRQASKPANTSHATLQSNNPAVESVTQSCGRWYLVAKYPGGTYRVPVEVHSNDAGNLQCTALTSGLQIKVSRIDNNELTFQAVSPLGPLRINATLDGQRLKGEWQANFLRGQLTGERSQMVSSPPQRIAVFDEVCRTIDSEFYDLGFNGIDWKEQKTKFRPRAANLGSDAELFQLVTELLATMKSSHLAFSAISSREISTTNSEVTNPSIDEAAAKAIRWKRLDENVGYLKISSFMEGQALVKRIDRAFSELAELPGLIIDLRDNSGGTLSAAMRLGDYLLDQPQRVGYFATRSGLLKRKVSSMEQLDMDALSPYSGYDVTEFLSLLRRDGAVVLQTGGRAQAPYRGKIVLLTNGRTASTSEGLVGTLKDLRRVTIIGQRTAGAMLSSKEVALNGGWHLTLPEADFRTTSGKRLEGQGIEPDIDVKPKKGEDPALQRAIDFLTES